MRSASRRSASSRLRACDRSSEATTRTSGPSFASKRSRCRGPRAREPATSNTTSTRVSAVLACWPPGPPLRENRHRSSATGMAHERDTCSTPSSTGATVTVPYPPSVAPATRRLRFEASLTAVLGHARRGTGDPCMRLWDRGCWRATRTPDGPSTLSLVVGGGVAEATAWGPGAAWTLEHLPDLLGHNDVTLDEFDPPLGVVRDLRRDVCVRIGRTFAVAEALVPTILEQRVTGGEARRSWRLLVRRLGEPAPGPLRDLRLPPTSDV